VSDRPPGAALPPLASFVLRVTGRPAVLRFELHDVRTGRRHRFVRADALLAFLRELGLDDPAPAEPASPADGSAG
jgi:hypothetical protein